MGRPNELGQIKPGFLADLLLVDGDPLADIKRLQNRDASIRDRLSLIGISLVTFLRYNRSVPRSAWPVWWIWLRDSWREARASL